MRLGMHPMTVLLHMRKVSTVKDLKTLLDECPGDWPVVCAPDGPLGDFEEAEAGEVGTQEGSKLLICPY